MTTPTTQKYDDEIKTIEGYATGVTGHINDMQQGGINGNAGAMYQIAILLSQMDIGNLNMDIIADHLVKTEWDKLLSLKDSLSKAKIDDIEKRKKACLINEKNITDFNTQVATLNLDLTNAQTQITDMTAEITKLNLEITTLKTENANLTLGYTSTQTQVTTLSANNAKLTLELTDLRKQYTDHINNHLNLNALVDYTVKSVKIAEARIADLELQLSNKNQQYADLEMAHGIDKTNLRGYLEDFGNVFLLERTETVDRLARLEKICQAVEQFSINKLTPTMDLSVFQSSPSSSVQHTVSTTPVTQVTPIQPPQTQNISIKSTATQQTTLTAPTQTTQQVTQPTPIPKRTSLYSQQK